jgi:endonuclease-3
MKPADIEPFFATLQAANPDPASELEYASVFELLCAVILSAQATDAGVNKATRQLFPIANTPSAILALGQERLTNAIRTIGLFRMKAKNLMRTCHILVEQHGGRVPRTREALEALPGVGRKTANVVLNVAFGESTLAVDTHVFRVSNRTGLAPGATPLEVETRLMQRVPPAYLGDAHHWLILHGRYVCLARRPLCERCAVARWCDSAPRALRHAAPDRPGAFVEGHGSAAAQAASSVTLSADAPRDRGVPRRAPRRPRARRARRAVPGA